MSGASFQAVLQHTFGRAWKLAPLNALPTAIFLRSFLSLCRYTITLMTSADSNLTPMMQQYRRIKREIPGDALLLFRLGDFCEIFGDDSKPAWKAG